MDKRDPRSGFIRIFENVAKLDALNQCTTHVGSGLFACPGGVREGQFLAQWLYQAAFRPVRRSTAVILAKSRIRASFTGVACLDPRLREDDCGGRG